jgi:thioredoxin-related protein
MKKLIVVFGLLMMIFTWGMTLEAADKVKRPDIYDAGLDVKTAIKTAMADSAKENKHILLMFGGNWCPWCHKLHHLFDTDKTVKEYLAKHFILILVDVGEKANEPLNRDLVDYYRVKGFGYPSLAVVSPKGRVLSAQSTGVLEKGKSHDPERVLGFLKAVAPTEK